MAVKKRCPHCLKAMRNDGTAENPKWVCNNPKCPVYVPPQENTTEDTSKK